MPVTSASEGAGKCPPDRARWSVLSRHWTSQGEITYRRCACGRIGIFLDGHELRLLG
ncbi:hypothetical protein [Saccharopolyspora sp. 5N708]|uniref:hypothetical protein n=1 Tax=Saccharopolyspora sp. 5N708 TaxID=3457424 RepID=UPI003FD3E2C0